MGTEILNDQADKSMEKQINRYCDSATSDKSFCMACSDLQLWTLDIEERHIHAIENKSIKIYCKFRRQQKFTNIEV